MAKPVMSPGGEDPVGDADVVATDVATAVKATAVKAATVKGATVKDAGVSGTVDTKGEDMGMVGMVVAADAAPEKRVASTGAIAAVAAPAGVTSAWLFLHS